MTDLPQWAVRRGMNLWSDIKEDCPHPSRDLDLLDETAPYLIARALAEAAKPRWQPIETAPKDTLCLLFEPHEDGGFLFVGCTNIDGEWVNNLDFCVQRPTHWLPLPAAPEVG